MCLLYAACHAKKSFADPLQMPHACQRLWNCHRTFTFCSLVGRCRISGACHAKPHLNIFSTSKSAPNLTIFNTFDFKMCFAPQWRVLFQQLNFQKCSGNGVPLPFGLPNVLPARAVCTFSTSQLPKVIRTWQFFTVLTSKRASCHNGVHFFNSSTSKSAPRTVCFLLLDLPEPQNLGKTQCFATFFLYVHMHLLSFDSFSSLIFFLLLFSSLSLPTSSFHLSIFPEVWLLNLR